MNTPLLFADEVLQNLTAMFRQQGLRLLTEPIELTEQLKALLGAKYKREYFLLRLGIEANVPLALAKGQGSSLGPQDFTLRLCNNFFIQPSAAAWIVETWTLVLERPLPRLRPTARTSKPSEVPLRYLPILLRQQGKLVYSSAALCRALLLDHMRGQSKAEDRGTILLLTMVIQLHLLGSVIATLDSAVASTKLHPLVPTLVEQCGFDEDASLWALQRWYELLYDFRESVARQVYEELQRGNTEEVARLYSDYSELLQSSPLIRTHFRDISQGVSARFDTQRTLLRRAILLQKEAECLSLYQPLAGWFTQSDTLTPEELAYLRKLQHREQPLTLLQTSLQAHDDVWTGTLFADHEALLRASATLTVQDKRTLYALVQRQRETQLRESIEQDNDLEIASAADALVQHGYFLEPQSALRLGQAGMHTAQLRVLHLAIAQNNDQAIVLALESLGAAGRLTLIPPDKAARVTLAQKRWTCWLELQTALALEDDTRLAHLYDPELFEDAALLTAAVRTRCDLAVERSVLVKQIRAAVQAQNTEAIAALYNTSILGNTPLLTPAEHRSLAEQARTFQLLKALEQELEAIERQSTLIERSAYLSLARAYTQVRNAKIALPSSWSSVHVHRIREALRIDSWLQQLGQAMQASPPDRSILVRIGQHLLALVPHILSPSEIEHITQAKRDGAAALIDTVHRKRRALVTATSTTTD